ncbi:MAG: PD40 domain-containing protein [Kofleriaceae bacterium]|nr:PD40 domain-containing protein [Kofleriaceae bacterium]
MTGSFAASRSRWGSGSLATVLLATGILSGCGPTPALGKPAVALDAILLVATERGGNGPRLVGIDASGDRQFDAVVPAAVTVRDSNPAISPDGNWIVFASSRGRDISTTSLWLARLGFEAEAVPLTHGEWIDTHPCWAADSRRIVFASTRSGNFDLWQVELTLRQGTLETTRLTQLTQTPTHEVSPSVARDGRIVFAVVAPADQAPSSHLAMLTPPNMVPVAISAGPGDSSPGFSPDGMTIAFTAPQLRTRIVDNKTIESVDGDIWSMPASGGPRSKLMDSAGTDEGGPVWSSDGRTLFATSLLRGANGRVMFSAIVFGDGIATHPVRMLIDRAGAVERLGPTLRPGRPTRHELTQLQSAPEYRARLTEIIRRAVERNGIATPQDAPLPASKLSQ